MVTRLFAIVLAAFIASLTATATATEPARFVPLLGTGDAIPPIPLVAQDKRTFTLADFRGDAVLVSFIYTRCRDARMCPLVTAKFSRIAHEIGNAPIHLVLVTLDPAYDTPAILQRYGRAFGQQDVRSWTLATGSAGTIDEVAKRLGIDAVAAAPGVIVHTEAAVVISPDGRIAQTLFGNAWSPADLLAAARATLPGGASDPFFTFRTWLSTTLERCGGGSIGLGGSAMLGIFGLAAVAVGGVFRQAFRSKPVRQRPTKS